MQGGDSRDFTFDAVYDATARQEDIYSETATLIVDSCMTGSVLHHSFNLSSPWPHYTFFLTPIVGMLGGKLQRCILACPKPLSGHAMRQV